MDVVRKGNSVIKRISLLMVAALMAAMMMVATAAPAFAAPANPHPAPVKEGPSDTTGATDPPGTCTEETQKGANATTTTTNGSCTSNNPNGETIDSKKPPGKNK